MIKNIHTLVKDIEDAVEADREWFAQTIAEGVAEQLRRLSLQPRRQADEGGFLRLSQMGEKCPCQLWHSIHSPSLQEPLPAAASVKYAFGHVIEAMTIELAKMAGHEVTGEQDVLVVDGVKGHRDCVIDGCLVDVKSASSMAFQKFKTGSIGMDDPFGYLAQLDGYAVGSYDDPLVRVKDRAYLFAVGKELGHMCIYEHRIRPLFIAERIANYKAIVERPTCPPCECGTEPDGESGNVKLDVRASYNPFKHVCAENRGERLRTFLYSNGPRFLVKVVRQPKRKDGSLIPEVDKHGKTVYN